MTTNPQTDPTAAIEVLARLLCAADVHVHGDDHPTWQQLSTTLGRGVQDDYRKAARWLLPRMTVTARADEEQPATEAPSLAADSPNEGPGWYEVINPRNATTNIALVYDDGSLYLPEGEDALTEEEFAFAAARGNAHRLVRADDQEQRP